MYRRLLREQMAIVEDGGEPMNVFRDPEKNKYIYVAQDDDPREPRTNGHLREARLNKMIPMSGQVHEETGEAVMFPHRRSQPDGPAGAENLRRPDRGKSQVRLRPGGLSRPMRGKMRTKRKGRRELRRPFLLVL